MSRLQAFYQAAFRWKFDEQMPGYSLAHTGTKGVSSGFMQIEGNAPVPPGVVTFVYAADLAEGEGAVREAGGQVVMSAQTVPGWGRFSVITDPDGNQLALWQDEAAVRKEEKRAAKAQKRAEGERAAAAAAPAGDSAKDAEKDGKKARKKEEKRAAKQAKKAQKSDGELVTKEGSSDKAPKDKKAKKTKGHQDGAKA